MSTVNFVALIAEIREKGLTVPAIAKKVDSSVGGIEGLAKGRSVEPRYSTGVKLVRLHKQMMKTD